MTETAFQRKVRERREREAAAASTNTAAASVPASPEYDDLVPDADSAYERSEADNTIDELIKNLSIDKAYDRWIGKPRPADRTGKREGVMISCPMPNHPDRNPSAWMNLDKNVWHCPGCSLGGDVMDLAAISFGVSNYKQGKAFGELRTAIANDLGYQVYTAPGVSEPMVTRVETQAPPPPVAPVPPPASVPVAAPTPTAAPTLTVVPTPTPPTVEAAESGGTVTNLHDDEEDRLIEIQLPTLDWKPLVAPGTFLDTYMTQTTRDDVPEEYHFWNALLAVSLAVGRDVTLYDSVPVLANLYVCIIGRTGSGKSRATNYVRRLVKEALPWDPQDWTTRGAKPMTVPGSAEHLISQFSSPIPSSPGSKIVAGYAPVRGLIEFNELSALVGRGSRSGSVLKPTLMQFFDGDPYITTGSKTGGTDIAENSFASCVTSVQPKALPTLVNQGDADSGFLNRWVFASGKRKKRVAIGGEIIDLDPCVYPLREIWSWAEDSRTIGWSEDAAAEFTEFYDHNIEELIGLDDTGLFARLDLLFKKLCLLLTANEMLEEVTEEIVIKVETIFRYLLEVFGVQADQMGNSLDRQCQQEIMAMVERKSAKTTDKAVALNDIIKTLKRKYELKMIKDNLSLLCEMDMMMSFVPEKKPGPGRPPQARYRLASGE